MSMSGLYPPIIESYLPAKVITGRGGQNHQDDITIPFNIDYNNITDIQEVHISLVRQSNYHNAFTNLYIRGVYITDDISQVSGNNYETVLPFNILNLQEISYNEYYKLQIRFSSLNGGVGKTGEQLSQYLTNESNLEHFSEWSTVCLIRFIAEPNLSLDCNGIEITDEIVNPINIDTSQVRITGYYYKKDFGDGSYIPLQGIKDNEYLYSYKFEIHQDNEKIFTSEEVLVDRQNPNEINYTLPYYFTNGNYQIYFYYTTANLYQNYISFQLRVEYSSESWSMNTKVAQSVAIDSVIGKVNISFDAIQPSLTPPSEDDSEEDPPTPEPAKIPVGSKFIIRRGSDKDDFQVWDTIYTKTLTEATQTVSFDDFTIESGILYKYELNFIDPDNNETYSMIVGPIISVFDHAFLTGEGTQLCVKFNPNISSLKTNVGDAIITTLGGQYPYIRRNGNMHYKSFSLTGTIAYEMDAQHQFATRSSIYGEWISVYGSYFVNRYINQRNDRVTQRKFRELVTAYLEDDVPKIFRSTPEGNILVRLTDVSLTPKNELGRMIYDFSCTATEIGDPSIENYKMYKIQDFGDE